MCVCNQVSFLFEKAVEVGIEKTGGQDRKQEVRRFLLR